MASFYPTTSFHQVYIEGRVSFAKPIKLLLLLLLPATIGFGAYAYKYHSLAMESWYLFNDRCNIVNPALIKLRKLHLGTGSALTGENPISEEQFKQNLESLPQAAETYLSLEKDWLEKQGALLNRRDFRLLEPEYMKDAGKYQLAMYQGYYDYYQTIGTFFDRTYKPEGAETENEPQETNPADNMQELLDKYQDSFRTNKELYNQAFDDGVKVKDWRKIFAQVPEPDCPEENLMIP